MEAKAKVALTFALYQGDQLLRRDTIAQDIVKVGKDPRSHLRVDDDLASRMHAVIEVAGPNDITLIDLGNEPGTMVNGQRVNKCKVRPGDQIQIGSTMIHLESAELAGAAAGQTAAMPAPPVPTTRVNTPTEAIAAAPVKASADPFGTSASQPPPAPAANPFGTTASQPPPAANPFAANPFAAVASPFAANPFVASAAEQGYGINSPGGSDFDPSQPYTFSLVKSGPDIHPDEVETHAAAIEVIVTGPRRQYGPRYRYCHMSSMRAGSRPISRGTTWSRR